MGADAATRSAAELGRAAEELSLVLLPVLRAGLAATTGELERLRQAGARALDGRTAGGSRKEKELVEPLDDLHRANERRGWILGVLGAGCGVDLLGLRCEPEGMRWMLSALVEGIAGLALQPGTDALPRVQCMPPGSWEVPLLATWMVLEAHEPAAPCLWSSRVTEPWTWFECALPQRATPFRPELEQRCAGLAKACGSDIRLEWRPQALALGYR